MVQLFNIDYGLVRQIDQAPMYMTCEPIICNFWAPVFTFLMLMKLKLKQGRKNCSVNEGGGGDVVILRPIHFEYTFYMKLWTI